MVKNKCTSKKLKTKCTSRENYDISPAASLPPSLLFPLVLTSPYLSSILPFCPSDHQNEQALMLGLATLPPAALGQTVALTPTQRADGRASSPISKVPGPLPTNTFLLSYSRKKQGLSSPKLNPGSPSGPRSPHKYTGWGKVGLQLYIHKTQSLFLFIHSFIIVLLTIIIIVLLYYY